MYKLKLKHRCKKCNRILTDELSIELELGPECRKDEVAMETEDSYPACPICFEEYNDEWWNACAERGIFPQCESCGYDMDWPED